MVAKGEIRSDGEPVGPALAHSAYVTAHQHEAARMIRDPGARISIMARAAADAAHPTGRIYDRNRSPKRPLLTACTRAGSIYDTKTEKTGILCVALEWQKWAVMTLDHALNLARCAGLDKAEQFTPELLWLRLEFGA